jgi:hypothetical protein
VQLFCKWQLLSADHDPLSATQQRPTRLFVVRCAGCGRTLMTVGRIADAEIAALEDHLRRCGPSERLGDEALLSEIMRRVRVEPVEPNS